MPSDYIFQLNNNVYSISTRKCVQIGERLELFDKEYKVVDILYQPYSYEDDDKDEELVLEEIPQYCEDLQKIHKVELRHANTIITNEDAISQKAEWGVQIAPERMIEELEKQQNKDMSIEEHIDECQMGSFGSQRWGMDVEYYQKHVQPKTFAQLIDLLKNGILVKPKE